MTLDPHRLRATAALVGANIAVSSRIDREVAASSQLDQTTADLLMRLHLEPGHRLRAVELCHQLMKSPSHISRLLDRAEAAGYVRREPDPNDRRAHQVVLLDTGSDAVTAFLPALDAVIEQVIFEPLSAAEIDTLGELLGRIETAAREGAC